MLKSGLFICSLFVCVSLFGLFVTREVEKSGVEDEITVSRVNEVCRFCKKNMDFGGGKRHPKLDEVIVSWFESNDPYLRREAIEILSQEGSSDSIEKIRMALWDSSAPVVIEAVEALGRLKANGTVEELMSVYQANRSRMDGYGESIRVAVIDALGEIGDVRAVSLLGQALREAEDFVYWDHVVEAHGRIGSINSLRYLEEHLNYLEGKNPEGDAPGADFLWNRAKEKVQGTIAALSQE